MTEYKPMQRFAAVLLTLLLVLSLFPISAFAAETEEPEAPPSEPTDETVAPTEAAVLLDSGDTVKIIADRSRQIQWIGHTDARLTIRYTDALGNEHSGWMTAINKYMVDDVYAYCIEPAIELGDSYTEDEAANAWAEQMTAGQRSAIALALAYGFPAQDFPAADPAGVASDTSLEYPLRTDLWQISEKYAATQIIIWEIVMGLRSPAPPYNCTDTTLIDSFYRTSNPYGYRADWNTLKKTYDTISASLASVGSIPSFSSVSAENAPVYELTFSESTGIYSLTLTDTNGTLSGYDFFCPVDGVTITKSNNTLTVTATAEAAMKLDGNVLCSAAGATMNVDPDTVVAVWSPNGEGQTAVSLKADPEPVNAYFKLTSKIQGGLEIIKTSSTGEVAGFEFRVQGNGIDQTVYSDAGGRIVLDQLKEGTYTVTEILPDDSGWYCTSQNPQTVTVEDGKTASVTFNNEKKKWSVQVFKEDRETGEAQADATLDGAVYGLYKDGKLVKEYTVQNGTFTSDEYFCGTGYTLQEISAPPGYQLDTTVYNLDAYSAPEKCPGPLKTSQVTVHEDVITGFIEIIKRTLNPVNQATALETGAVFRYWLKSAGSYDSCDESCKGSMTTGNDGKAKSKELPYGTYMVEQVSGAEGTHLADSFEVLVSEAGKTYTYTKDNPYWTGSVSILKVGEDSVTPLIATFALLDENKNVLETGTTGNDGSLSFTTTLVYGKTYYVQETVAPDGYALDETLHPITVTAPDQEISKTIVNSSEDGSISVRKVDAEGNKLVGVVFCLEYSTDGQNWTSVTLRDSDSPVAVGGCTSASLSNGCLTTDDSGSAVFTGLRISNSSGTVYYRLSELATKDGSTLMLEPVFEGELSADSGKDITITAVNSDVFELPRTGSHDLLFLQLAQILCTSASLFLFSRRKEQ